MKKTIYGSVITAFVVTAVFTLAACGNGNQTASIKNDSSEMNKKMDHKDGDMDHTDHGDSKDKKVESADFSDQRNSQTSAIIDAYDQTKSGLDADDKTKTAEGAKALIAVFKKFDATKLPEGKRKEYAEIVESAKEHAKHIVKSEIPHQKEHFEFLAKDMKDLLNLVNSDSKES